MEQAAQEGDHRPTWAHEWLAGERLRQILPSLLQHLLPKTDLNTIRCCDLGCGCGCLGFELLARGAMDVTFSDGSAHPLQFIASMLQHYELNATCLQQSWGTQLKAPPTTSSSAATSYTAQNATKTSSQPLHKVCRQTDKLYSATHVSSWKKELPVLAKQHKLITSNVAMKSEV